MQGIRESDFARRASTGQPPPLTATRAKGVRPGTHRPAARTGGSHRERPRRPVPNKLHLRDRAQATPAPANIASSTFQPRPENAASDRQLAGHADGVTSSPNSLAGTTSKPRPEHRDLRRIRPASLDAGRRAIGRISRAASPGPVTAGNGSPTSGFWVQGSWRGSRPAEPSRRASPRNCEHRPGVTVRRTGRLLSDVQKRCLPPRVAAGPESLRGQNQA
jgi:hypothetical protein